MSVLSIVIPCYNEEETIPVFYRRVCEQQDQIKAELEFCFVDDGSTDQTLPVLKELREQDDRVHYVSFSRNFGKEAALLAGLELSGGDYVVTMDVDLQDPPSLLPEMYKIVSDPSNGFDSVATRRTDRTGEPPLRSFFARQFYRGLQEALQKVPFFHLHGSHKKKQNQRNQYQQFLRFLQENTVRYEI